MDKRYGLLWRMVVLGLVLLVAAGPVSAAASDHFRAHLSGSDAGVDTLSQGQTIFRLNEEGTEVYYKLIVANLDDTFMAHIHLAPAGENGPVVAWLYPGDPPPELIPGRFSGVLAEGTITSADLTGPLAGMTLADLVAEMRAGNTYVNVHTLAHPGGEIRGQISVQGR